MAYEVELTFHIIQTCIDRRSRKHQYFHIASLNVRLVLYQGCQQLLIAARLLIAQVMALIDDIEYLLACLQIVSTCILIGILHTVVLQVGMETHNIVKLVFLKARTMTFQVLRPVFFKFLRTEKHSQIVLRLEVLDDSQSRESLTKTYSVCKDGTVVLTQHLDKGYNALLLIVEQRFPNNACL